MAPVLRLGSFDVSRWVRLAPGEAFDPVSQGHFEPVWSESPLAEGAEFDGEDVANKEFVAPLIIGDSGRTTPDQLAAIRAQLTHALRPGARIEMREESASESSWWTLKYARWEEDYSYRLSQAGGAKGRVRMWCSPYADTNVDRLVATGAGTGPALTVPIASIGGDAPAALNVRITAGSAPVPEGRFVAVAALPHPSYVVQWRAASLIDAGAGELVGDPLGVASQARRLQTGLFGVGHGIALELPLQPMPYVGRNRLLAAVRCEKRDGGVLWAADDRGEPLGPTAVVMTRPPGFGIVDLGVFSVASPLSPSSVYRLAIYGQALSPPGTLDNTFRPPEVTALYVVPEEAAAFVVDQPDVVALDRFANGASGPLAGNVDSLGNAWTPDGPPYLTGTGLYVHPNINGVAAVGGPYAVQRARLQADLPGRGDFRVKIELFVLPPAASVSWGQTFEIERPATEVGVDGTAARFVIGLNPYLQAGPSRSGPRVNFSPTGLEGGYYELALTPQTVTLRSHGTMPMRTSGGQQLTYASVAHPSWAGDNVGYVTIGLANGSVTAIAPRTHLDSVTIETRASPPLPRDVYLLDGLNRVVARTSPGGLSSRRMDGEQRGRVPALQPPAAAAVAVLSHPLGAGGSGQDILGVEVRVRERFRYLR